MPAITGNFVSHSPYVVQSVITVLDPIGSFGPFGPFGP